ncbi:hypothetical protein GCM10027294_07190 [Marinactinospora endophytica]
MNAPMPPAPPEAEEAIIDLGDAAVLTLGEGSDDNEDKRKIYN